MFNQLDTILTRIADFLNWIQGRENKRTRRALRAESNREYQEYLAAEAKAAEDKQRAIVADEICKALEDKARPTETETAPSGRPSYPDDEWARAELANGRDKKEVYLEWAARPEVKLRALANPQESFDKLRRGKKGKKVNS